MVPKFNTKTKKEVLNYGKERYSGHILDLYCIRLLCAAPFCKNYAKASFGYKTLGKGIEEGKGEKFLLSFSFKKKCPFFIKKCPFWPVWHAALNF